MDGKQLGGGYFDRTLKELNGGDNPTIIVVNTLVYSHILIISL